MTAALTRFQEFNAKIIKQSIVLYMIIYRRFVLDVHC